MVTISLSKFLNLNQSLSLSHVVLLCLSLNALNALLESMNVLLVMKLVVLFSLQEMNKVKDFSSFIDKDYAFLCFLGFFIEIVSGFWFL